VLLGISPSPALILSWLEATLSIWWEIPPELHISQQQLPDSLTLLPLIQAWKNPRKEFLLAQQLYRLPIEVCHDTRFINPWAQPGTGTSFGWPM
jgi:hypothetical protein